MRRTGSGESRAAHLARGDGGDHRDGRGGRLTGVREGPGCRVQGAGCSHSERQVAGEKATLNAEVLRRTLLHFSRMPRAVGVFSTVTVSPAVAAVLLRLVQLARRADDDLRDEITASVFVQMGNTLATNAKLLPALRSFGILIFCVAIQRGEIGFPRPMPPEEGNGNEANGDRFLRARRIWCGQPEHDGQRSPPGPPSGLRRPRLVANARAVFHARGDAHRDLVLALDASFAAAGMAGIAERFRRHRRRCSTGDGEESLLVADLPRPWQ